MVPAEDFAQCLLVGKDGDEATEAQVAAHRAAVLRRPTTVVQAATAPSAALQGLQQHPAAQLPIGVVDDGLRGTGVLLLHTLGKITLDHEACATNMVQIESEMEITEEVQKSLYVEPISFTPVSYTHLTLPTILPV